MTKIAKKVDPRSIETQRIIKTMFDAMQPNMVGLAAPQIGIHKRIILVDVAADGRGKVGDLRVYINPEIIWKSKKEGEWYEGCFSVDKICGIVSRPVSVKIRAFVLKTLGVRSLPPRRWDIVFTLSRRKRVSFL